MTLTLFAELVKDMREAQKEFFAGLKTNTQLAKCQALEQKVDKALTIIKQRQGTQAPISFTGVDEYEG